MQKKYVVAKQFTDSNGRTWQQGEEYTGEDAAQQTQQGNVREQPQQK